MYSNEIRNLWKNKPDYSIISFKSKKVFSVLSGQTHYKKYFHKSWREGVRHRAKRLFLGLPRERHYNSFYTPKNV